MEPEDFGWGVQDSGETFRDNGERSLWWRVAREFASMLSGSSPGISGKDCQTCGSCRSFCWEASCLADHAPSHPATTSLTPTHHKPSTLHQSTHTSATTYRPMQPMVTHLLTDPFALPTSTHPNVHLGPSILGSISGKLVILADRAGRRVWVWAHGQIGAREYRQTPG